MKIVRLIEIVVACLIPFIGESQSFKDRIQSIQKTYGALDQVKLEMTIQVFESSESISPYFSQVAKINKKTNNYHYRLGEMEMLMNDRYLLMVDHASREIVCSARSVETEQAFQQDPFQMNLDSILNLYEQPELISKNDDQEHYRVIQKSGPVSQIDLVINSKDNVLKRLEYHYTNKQFVVIEFTRFEMAPHFGELDFAETQYMVQDKGKWKSSARYAGYNVSVLNQ